MTQIKLRQPSNCSLLVPERKVCVGCAGAWSTPVSVSDLVRCRFTMARDGHLEGWGALVGRLPVSCPPAKELSGLIGRQHLISNPRTRDWRSVTVFLDKTTFLMEARTARTGAASAFQAGDSHTQTYTSFYF